MDFCNRVTQAGYYEVMPSDVPAEVVLARLSLEVREWVEAFRDGVREKLGPRLKDLRIFGSRVRGEEHEESDVDLLVLVEDLDYDTRREVVDLAHSISPWLSAVVLDFERYHLPKSRATGFYKEMRKESVRL